MTPAQRKALELRNRAIVAKWTGGDFCVRCDAAGKENVKPVATIVQAGRGTALSRLVQRGSRGAVLHAAQNWLEPLCLEHLVAHVEAPFAAGRAELKRLHVNQLRRARYVKNKAETGDGQVGRGR
jgi:hypothetical protein